MKTRCLYKMCLLLLLINTACSDFLEVEVPKNQIDQKMVFSNDALATAAISDLYTSLRERGFLTGYNTGIGVLLGTYTDELTVTSSQMLSYQYFYEGIVYPNNEGIKELWSASYRQIYTTNAILEGLEQSSGVSEALRNQLNGEVLAIRALLHFYLTQTFGKVPYVKTTDYTVNKQIEKWSTEEVMQQAIADLKEAENLLSQTYSSGEKVRINQTVVQALLARLYLFQKNWTMAGQYAQLVMNNPNYELEPLERVFLKDSKSAIWQFKPEIMGANAIEPYTYQFTEQPAPHFRLSNNILNAFETNDLRKPAYTFFLDANIAYVNKYKILGFTSESQEYTSIIRLEEMYLIGSEAAAQLNDWDTCTILLNKIRNRANLQSIQINSLSQALNAILQERRIEFLCEFGHRFYDLKRTERLSILIEAKPNWKPHFDMLPLPEDELLLNTSLMPQNPGY